MNVLEELTDFEDRIDRAHVERRLRDWEVRLDALYRQVDGWLPRGWTTSRGGTVPTREALLERFGIADRRLPILSLRRDETVMASLEPQNLWIIGSNGRVDLLGMRGHHVINDRSDFFEPPRWCIAAFERRSHEVPLTADVLARILG